MKKPTKRDTINLFFSAFLIIAFIVCAHFFSQYASALSQPLGSIIPILVYAVFGLLMFYASKTRSSAAYAVSAHQNFTPNLFMSAAV